MTNTERKQINAAIKILRRDWPKKNRCKEFVTGCPQCVAYRTIEEFESLVNDFMNTDEEMKKVAKKIRK